MAYEKFYSPNAYQVDEIMQRIMQKDMQPLSDRYQKPKTIINMNQIESNPEELRKLENLFSLGYPTPYHLTPNQPGAIPGKLVEQTDVFQTYLGNRGLTNGRGANYRGGLDVALNPQMQNTLGMKYK